MANTKEKEALGLKADATDDDVMNAIIALRGAAAVKSPGGPRRILAVISKTGQERRRGTYVIPPDRALVLDEDAMDEAHIAAIDADSSLMKVRTGTELTSDADIERFKPSA